MQKKLTSATLALLALLFMIAGCKKQDSHESEQTMPEEQTLEIKGDSMVYGLSCDGTSDSVMILWPFNGGDPITYNTVEASHEGRIIGKPQIGDWVGVMLNPEDSTEATMVINLDQLKGTWTYPVMPVMKELQNMSRRMQKRMMENVPDSVKQAYFIPREYGFTLKRGHKAQPVGNVRRSTSLEDDSPVQYPAVKRYVLWYMWNGKLILASSNQQMTLNDTEKKLPLEVDTLDILYLDNDSLILDKKGTRYGFHRKENAMVANAAATKAQQMHDKQKTEASSAASKK